MEDYLAKQNKHKKGNKNKTRNKKVLNCKPRFTPREYKPTSPIHTSPSTDTTTVTQYTQPTHKNHTSTYTKPQLLPQYTTAFHCQPNTDHILKRTYAHHSSKRGSTLPTTYTTTHLQHHVPLQPTHKTHTAITNLITSTLAHKSFHVHRQYKHTLTHQANNKN